MSTGTSTSTATTAAMPMPMPVPMTNRQCDTVSGHGWLIPCPCPRCRRCIAGNCNAGVRSSLGRCCRLLIPQRRVPPARQRQQLVVRAPLHDAAAFKHDDLLGKRNGRQAVRDGDDGAARAQAAESLCDESLGVCVQRLQDGGRRAGRQRRCKNKGMKEGG